MEEHRDGSEKGLAHDWLNELAGKTVEQVIFQSKERLRDGFPYFVKNESFDEWLKEVAESIQRGEIDNGVLAHWWGEFLFGELEGANDVPYVHASIFTVMAEHALESGDPARAWPLITHASYCEGMAESISVQKGGDAQKRSTNARKGGEKKAETLGFGPLKAELVRSLRAPPDGGWKGMKTTAVALEKRFNDSLASTWSNALPPDLYGSIYRWLAADCIIRSAFKENQSRVN